MNNAQLRLPAVMNERLLFIADYQRPYAWERKQLQDLWDDLDLLGSGRSHYAGTLVLRDLRDGEAPRTSMADDGTTLRHCEVADGQQQPTTCLLLLDRVRRRLEALGNNAERAPAMAATLRANYGLVSIDNAKQPRLRLGAGLNAYWVDVVIGNAHPDGQPLIAGQRRLRDAAAFFDELSLRQHGQELPRMSEFTSSSGEQRTCEHVLPRHPTADAERWWGAFSKEQHTALQHTIDDLCLTYDNPSYGNKCFEAKRSDATTTARCYAKAELLQERELAKLTAWPPDEVSKRQARLTDRAMTRWAVARRDDGTLTEDVDIEPEGDDSLEEAAT